MSSLVLTFGLLALVSLLGAGLVLWLARGWPASHSQSRGRFLILVDWLAVAVVGGLRRLVSVIFGWLTHVLRIAIGELRRLFVYLDGRLNRRFGPRWPDQSNLNGGSVSLFLAEMRQHRDQIRQEKLG